MLDFPNLLILLYVTIQINFGTANLEINKIIQQMSDCKEHSPFKTDGGLGNQEFSNLVSFTIVRSMVLY